MLHATPRPKLGITFSKLSTRRWDPSYKGLHPWLWLAVKTLAATHREESFSPPRRRDTHGQECFCNYSDKGNVYGGPRSYVLLSSTSD